MAAPVAAAGPAAAGSRPVVPDTPAALLEPGGLVPLAKPPVRKLAKDLGVDLRALTGAGDGGVITRDDVAARGRARRPRRTASACATGARERRVPIKGVRKATAAAMVDSAFTAPHVTEFLDRRRHPDDGAARPAASAPARSAA